MSEGGSSPDIKPTVAQEGLKSPQQQKPNFFQRASLLALSIFGVAGGTVSAIDRINQAPAPVVSPDNRDNSQNPVSNINVPPERAALATAVSLRGENVTNKTMINGRWYSTEPRPDGGLSDAEIAKAAVNPEVETPKFVTDMVLGREPLAPSSSPTPTPASNTRP